MRIFAHGGDLSWQAQGKAHVLVLQSRLFVTGSEAFYFEMQFFGAGAALLRHGGDRRGAQIS